MVAMVANAERASDEFRDTQRRPDVCPVSVSQWPLQKIFDQTHLLPVGQSRRSARCRPGAKGFLAALQKSITPTHHRTGVAAQAPGHFVQRTSILDECHGAKTPPFQFRRRSFWAHRTYPPCSEYASLLHYLCRSQRTATLFAWAGRTGWFCDTCVDRGRHLFQLARMPIRRHVEVWQDANLFDPAWRAYFAQRRSLTSRPA
jgi:hypothetical protein